MIPCIHWRGKLEEAFLVYRKFSQSHVGLSKPILISACAELRTLVKEEKHSMHCGFSSSFLVHWCAQITRSLPPGSHYESIPANHETKETRETEREQTRWAKTNWNFANYEFSSYLYNIRLSARQFFLSFPQLPWNLIYRYCHCRKVFPTASLCASSCDDKWYEIFKNSRCYHFRRVFYDRNSCFAPTLSIFLNRPVALSNRSSTSFYYLRKNGSSL